MVLTKLLSHPVSPPVSGIPFYELATRRRGRYKNVSVSSRPTTNPTPELTSLSLLTVTDVVFRRPTHPRDRDRGSRVSARTSGSIQYPTRTRHLGGSICSEDPGSLTRRSGLGTVSPSPTQERNGSGQSRSSSPNLGGDDKENSRPWGRFVVIRTPPTGGDDDTLCDEDPLLRPRRWLTSSGPGP